MNTNLPVLQPTQVFFHDMLEKVYAAKKRIWIQSMLFEYSEGTKLLEKALIDAAKRHVDVHITLDWIQNRSTHGEFSVFPINKSNTYAYNLQRQTQAMFKRLEKAGVKVTITNVPFFSFTPLPYIRRNHRKIILIDEYAWMGGVNLIDPSLPIQDFMVRFNNTKLTKVLTQVFLSSNKKQRENANYTISPSNQLLVDNGIMGNSIIYKNSLDAIQQAHKNIIFVAYILPDGQLLHKLIQKSKENIAVTIITSPRKDHVFTKYPHRGLYLASLLRLKRYPKIRIIYSHAPIHAKILLIDGNKLLFGSHNFVGIGGLIGTKEIAMQTTEASLIKQIQSFINTL